MFLFIFLRFSELAYKILVTGKSINFLKEICEEKATIKGKKELKDYFESNGNLLATYLILFSQFNFFGIFGI